MFQDSLVFAHEGANLVEMITLVTIPRNALKVHWAHLSQRHSNSGLRK